MRLVWIVLALLLAGSALASALIVVQPGERVVVRRLGRKLPRELSPGLHLVWPLGLDQLDRVKANEVRRLRVGLSDLPTFDDSPGQGEFLSGDRNLVRVELQLLYRVDDPSRFRLDSSDAAGQLGQVADAALARSLAHRPIDSILGSDRSRVGPELAESLRNDPVVERLGVQVIDARLVDARPPHEVASDFTAAQTARSEADRRLQEASTRALETTSSAQSRAEALVVGAHAAATRTHSRARASASRFESIRSAADENRDQTIRGLYADAMKELLPRPRQKLLVPGDDVDISLYDERTPEAESPPEYGPPAITP